MLQTKHKINLLASLLAVSVAANLVLFYYLQKPKPEPEWRAAKVTEAVAASQGYRPEFMQLTMRKAMEAAESGSSGVAAVIVKDGKVLAVASNEMRKNMQSFYHGEICAIRDAEKALGEMDLEGCELYTSAQPCVMCESAISWAKIAKVYYAASVTETSKFEHFDDLKQYEALYQGKNLVPSVGVKVANPIKPIEIWWENYRKKYYGN